MFLGTYYIDEYVAIPAVCHRFSSGAAYAPTAISYSIYEEGNTTGLDEDIDMTPASPFDSVVGLYYARRQLTAAAGFEVNKTYVVVVKATVDSVAAIEAHVFQVRALSVAQTGDSYAIVNNGTYGNSALNTAIGALVAPDNAGIAAIQAKTDNLPADPAATGDIPTAAANADAVWDEALAGHAGAGSAGAALTGATAPSAADVADAVWDEALAGHAGAGSAGKQLADIVAGNGATAQEVVDAIWAERPYLKTIAL